MLTPAVFRDDLAAAEKPPSPVVSHREIVEWLGAQGDDALRLFARARETKERHVGRKVYFRGLVEISNVCRKSCLYCGVRGGNRQLERYSLSDDEVVAAARLAHERGLASMVLQAGERTDPAFVDWIDRLIRRIGQATDDALRLTLSFGEQSADTYRRWFDSGASRYLLRIETSSPSLYARLHPHDGRHEHSARLDALRTLKRVGYQVGTGVMVGLPWQTLEDLADDLLFFREHGFPMFGLGPYLEQAQAPLSAIDEPLLPRSERLFLSFKVIAALRLLLPDVNIAATTAMQAVDPMGRERALQIAANVVMPNLTPKRYRPHYFLYDGKPCAGEEGPDCLGCLARRIAIAGGEPAYGEWGDSLRYTRSSAAA